MSSKHSCGGCALEGEDAHPNVHLDMMLYFNPWLINLGEELRTLYIRKWNERKRSTEKRVLLDVIDEHSRKLEIKISALCSGDDSMNKSEVMSDFKGLRVLQMQLKSIEDNIREVKNEANREAKRLRRAREKLSSECDE